MKFKYLISLLLLLAFDVGVVLAQVPAFPGAQGAGAASVGGSGRNGTGTPVVFEVTNLNDTGSGSLRACVEASGPRFCIFRVSGKIVFHTRFQFSHPYITIAGQTSPGGIVFQSADASSCNGSAGCGAPFISTHDVTMRYFTYDGSANTPTGPDTGTVGVEFASGNAFNDIIDHFSCRWWGNACYDITSNDAGNTHEITMQWSLFYEPNAQHPILVKLDATSGSALHTTNTDFHHNMGTNFDHRWPMSSIRSFRWVSNILYNGGQDGDSAYYSYTWGGAQADYISNKYVDGPDSESHTHVILANHDNGGSDASDNCLGGAPCDNPGPPSFYLINNISHKCTSSINSCTLRTMVSPTHVVNDSNQILQTSQGSESAEESKSGITLGAMPGGWFRSSPLPAQTYPITADASETLDGVILPTVGNSQTLACTGGSITRRDSQDARVIAQYQAGGKGAMFTGQYSSPGPITGNPLCAESMHDGIPDAWKSANGFSTTDPNLWKQTASNGYLILENYLNQIGQANGSGAGTGTSGGGGGTTGNNPPPTNPDPTPIPALTISGITTSTITPNCATFNWTTNNAADSRVGYGICPTSLTFTPCCAPANVTAHTVTQCGLLPSTQYHFVTQSFDGNTTATSGDNTFTTPAQTTGGNPTTPTAPTLKSNVPTTTLNLSWTASSSPGVTSYKVYRSSVSGTGFLLEAQVTSTNFSDSAVQTGQTWYYVVTAVAPGDTTPESGFSNQIQVIVP